MKVLKTNWINLLGVFLAVLIYAVVLNLATAGLSYNLFQAIFAALIAIILYGSIFWALLAVSLLVLDLILLLRNRNHLTAKLLLEWLIISSPFIYWFARYTEWIFLAGVAAFLVTQLLRARLIKKAIG